MASTVHSKTAIVHRTVMEQILDGVYAPGEKLPSHHELAASFEVSAVTMRNVLARLESDGFVVREQGRGTFVRHGAMSSVLVVDDEATSRLVLARYAKEAGLRPLVAVGPDEGLAALAGDRTIALVVTDVHMPDKQAGIGFIRKVRRRRPDLPIAAVTGHADDLAELHGTPDCPYLVLSKPVQPPQIMAVLRAAMNVQREVERVRGTDGEGVFLEIVQQSMRHARRNGHLLALLILRSASLHPSHGAALVRSIIRESDALAVLQDDEIAVVLSDVGSRDNALAVAEKIVRACGSGAAGEEASNDLSTGISLFPFDGEDAAVLMARTREAVHRASPGSIEVAGRLSLTV